MEGALPSSWSPSTDYNWCKFRGVLLHMLQPDQGDSKRHIFPCKERKVSMPYERYRLAPYLCYVSRFQQLELKHVEDRGCFAAMEFRWLMNKRYVRIKRMGTGMGRMDMDLDIQATLSPGPEAMCIWIRILVLQSQQGMGTRSHKGSFPRSMFQSSRVYELTMSVPKKCSPGGS